MILNSPNLRENYVDVTQIDFSAMVGDIIPKSGEDALVDVEKEVERSEADVQAGKVG